MEVAIPAMSFDQKGDFFIRTDFKCNCGGARFRLELRFGGTEPGGLYAVCDSCGLRVRVEPVAAS